MNIKQIQRILIDWYQNNKRDLPWRYTTNPYHIWVSEIILQQTQVKQGYDYYLRFIEQFPTISALAKSPEDQVLKLWQGLGYYSRARNMHAAAKQIESIYNGIFPNNYAEILSLKGIGEYTAAAIASFAYGLPHAALDGNVFRVIARLTGTDTPIDTTAGKKLFQQKAQEFLNLEDVATHNQAMMEFGATQCKPVNPDCEGCPLKGSCFAFNNNMVELLPVKQGKIAQRNRYFYYINLTHQHQLLLHKRGEKDIWQGLYEFPLIESATPLETEELLKLDCFKALVGAHYTIKKISAVKKHVLSHQRIFAQCLEVEANYGAAITDYQVVDKSELGSYPMSRLMETLVTYLEKH